MGRRVRLDTLRGMDPVMLEVSVGEALRRPLGQIDPNTLVELLALPEAENLPATLASAAGRFRERIAREIADIPDGPPWEAFLAELVALSPSVIPQWLRDQVAVEAAREDRSVASGQLTSAVVERWAEIEPERFALGTRGVRVNRALPSAGAGSGGRERRPRATASPKSSAPKASRAPRASAYVDEARIATIQQMIQERLARYADAGLAENILLIGVRKQIQSADPGATPADVTHALKDLESKGLVQRGAGRWKLSRTW